MSTHPFFIGLGRAMISLGPLSETRYCTYKCKFCYVQSDKWGKYLKLSINDILKFLRQEKQKNAFNIIYISGDTDSFAPPRTKVGLKLLRKLLEFNTDVTITTRYVFNQNELNDLIDIANEFKRKGLFFSVSISIPRLYSNSYIESSNTPTPNDRIDFLKRLKSSGIYTLAAIRPLLPIISEEEYKELIEKCSHHVDAILGEVWYVDKDGIIEKEILINRNGFHYDTHKVDFNLKENDWKVWSDPNLIRALTKYSETLGVKFFMRSKPAFKHIKEKIYNKTK